MVLHVIGDALGNVGVIASALIIWLTSSPSRFYADPAVSLFITLIILRSAIPLTSATAKILLQATPDHLDVNDIKEDIQGIPGVVSCHHVHIWQLSDSQIIASMHIQVAFPISTSGGAERYMQVAKAIRKCLHAYGIHSATIQPEFCTDVDHDHVDAAASPGEGAASPRAMDADDCLLGCVDNCLAKGCCATSLPTTVIGSHDSRASQGGPGRGVEGDDHGHGEHAHDHEGHAH
jgi:zinc transporter 1